MLDMAVTIITCDRTKKGGINYLFRTLDSLAESALPEGWRTFVHCSDKAGESAYLNGVTSTYPGLRMRAYSAATDTESSVLTNVVYALACGARYADWVLFLEDDILVCADFFGSVSRWLDVHAVDGPMIYSFGANYPMPKHSDYWIYPRDKFYGTQAFAIRRRDAISLADFLSKDKELKSHPGTYDLAMHRWAKAQGLAHFIASNPSFVQHIGISSAIRKGGAHFQFPSFKGEDWSYQPEPKPEPKPVKAVAKPATEPAKKKQAAPIEPPLADFPGIGDA